MEKIKVIFRLVHNPYVSSGWEVEVFFPEFSANYGMIQCYSAVDGWCEASVEYYQNNTCAAHPDDYAELLESLREDDTELLVRKRMDWNDLRDKAWKRVV